ncbi:hypothetical protein FF38_08803 [Lucilia cuprina]|uniref:Uncharacterized protein n=1 Tax=Lucilia cuprina TaxID=7375 RepID=A0A0L0BS94_LUCCU|nr:hypothetical protein FF38_08803 [Lucilia cuprina]
MENLSKVHQENVESLHSELQSLEEKINRIESENLKLLSQLKKESLHQDINIKKKSHALKSSQFDHILQAQLQNLQELEKESVNQRLQLCAEIDAQKFASKQNLENVLAKVQSLLDNNNFLKKNHTFRNELQQLYICCCRYKTVRDDVAADDDDADYDFKELNII